MMERLYIKPSRPCGTVHIPGSKSLTHRALIASALCEGTTTLQNVLSCDDTERTADALVQMGVQIEKQGTTWMVSSPGKHGLRSPGVIHCGDSASTFRFLLPVCLACFGEAECILGPSLKNRSEVPYEELLYKLGFLVLHVEEFFKVIGTLEPGSFQVDVSVTSQILTGLMFALAGEPETSTIFYEGEIESRPYVMLTSSVLHSFGVPSCVDKKITLQGGLSWRTPGTYTIEGDWSTAAFYVALQHLDYDIIISGLNPQSLQGDLDICSFLRTLDEHPMEIIDLHNTPDLAPILFVYAAMKNGGIFTGWERLLYKETDRLHVMMEELAKCGVQMELHEPQLVVHPGYVAPSVSLSSHGDHRIAIALSLLLLKTGGILEDPSCVSKSDNEFFMRMERDLKCSIQKVD